MAKEQGREAPRKKKRRVEPAAAAKAPDPGLATSGWEEEDGTAPLAAEPQAPPAKKLSKHAKKKAHADREKEIRQAELHRLEADESAPSSAAEFEQLVLSSPGSSYAWIQYMAFLAAQGAPDKARALATRALAAIPYREEGEKFNVWVAALNLENAHGSEDDALRALGAALAHTDARRMYLAAVEAFARAQRPALVEHCLKAMTRKFSEAPEVWLCALRHRAAERDAAGGAATLERALRALPAREHVGIISQAALLEFRQGDAERGRSLMEGVLRNYPRRTDLWSVYIDQELAQGDGERIRALFERATHLQLPPKKMKFLFKRYLDYERKRGSAEGVAHVKRRAMEFVEQSLGGAAAGG